ncbi:Methyltransferase domain-containing protein [Ruegeria halocynthiae]|uniref:Methyltransferase domain-containing protein n=1 Tax=Ruegeria halocynthiae TaxID=985054 RepID=A0A1H2W1K0_9RHOB|nr:class I SAM-dependent methyltransferase [Ruegeria halocynthiae]SDW73979.1 Methyltransferase domain-containing protein [Ruegeria halocynthiae]
MRNQSQPITSERLGQKYDAAAPGWADKMRLLGYFDAYLGFLSADPVVHHGQNALDVGCGTGAFAEARAVVQPNGSVTLLEPSEKMLHQAKSALARRGVDAVIEQSRLEDFSAGFPYDCILAAHVLEHCPKPVDALRRMRELATPGTDLWLVVSKPHWCNAIIWFQWRHRTYRPEVVADMLARSGWDLRTEHSFPTGPPSRTSRGYKAVAI